MTKKEEIIVIGIDPAPSKMSTIYDGDNFMVKTYSKLQDCINESTEGKTLICWDAPLSFSMEDLNVEIAPLYERKIEYFFRKEWTTPPSGISVLGYSGCPHWTISQYILGYPQIKPYANNIENPFKLIFNTDDIKKNKISVTEVHPAVAIWLWCVGEGINNWEYKKDKNALVSILDVLKSKQILDDKIICLIMEQPRKKQDDYLDAYIAWKLGADWVKESNNGNSNVRILGNNDTGSFLLPYDKKLYDDFETLKNSEEKKQKNS